MPLTGFGWPVASSRQVEADVSAHGGGSRE